MRKLISAVLFVFVLSGATGCGVPLGMAIGTKLFYEKCADGTLVRTGEDCPKTKVQEPARASQEKGGTR